MSSNEVPNQKSFASIQRYNGEVLGAVLWIPASVIEEKVSSGQEKIDVSFEGDVIRIGKAGKGRQ